MGLSFPMSLPCLFSFYISLLLVFYCVSFTSSLFDWLVRLQVSNLLHIAKLFTCWKPVRSCNAVSCRLLPCLSCSWDLRVPEQIPSLCLCIENIQKNRQTAVNYTCVLSSWGSIWSIHKQIAFSLRSLEKLVNAILSSSMAQKQHWTDLENWRLHFLLYIVNNRLR